MTKQEMSVGFADMHHFVPLIAAVGWERAIEYLQDGFNAVGDAIVGRQGQIRKYLGDAVLFTFDDPGQAITAAREMAGYRREVGAITLRFYVAVATGEVFVTQIGHSSYRVEDILGEPVNRAFGLIRQARVTEDGIALDDASKKHS